MEHLEIGTLVLNSIISIDKERQLSLPNLRVLSIHFLEGNPIALDLPKLSKLLFNGRFNFSKSTFQLLHPTSVTHLAVNGSYFSLNRNEFLQQFPECQYLHFLDWDFMHGQLIFARLPKLKEIHCYTLTKKDILNLIKQRRVSRMLNVQIYFNGFSANDLDEVEELFGDDDRFVLTTDRFVSNYHILPRVVQMQVDLDYNQLVRHFNNRLPSGLHTKLSKTQKLRIIGNVDDQDCLLRFIGKLKPRNLEIKYTSLNQASYFYENLHLHWNHGVSLRIEENPDVITNLDFLINLDDLYAFSINQQIPYELIERLFDQFRRHLELEFLLKDQLVKIVLNNHHLGLNESHFQISEQEYTYTNDKFLDRLRQVLGIY